MLEGSKTDILNPMHTYGKSAFLQPLPEGITDNCDIKHRVTRGNPEGLEN